MRTIAAAACAILLLGSGACDFNDPDEIQNQANMALVRVQFFASSTSRTPVPGVRMIVEAPQQQQGGGGQVVFLYQGAVVPYLEGLTINSGRLFDLGAVYLDEFGVVVD